MGVGGRGKGEEDFNKLLVGEEKKGMGNISQ